MDKEAKKMTYEIEPLVKLLRAEANSDGGTQKKASALKGTWIRLNEYEHVFEEEDKVTRVYSDGKYVGCACGRCDNGVLCEHLILFEDLKSPPQLTIESPDYRWLRTYLMGLKWYVENRYLYPPIGEELPGDEAKEGLDPVNADHDLNIGVDDEPKQKTYSRKCVHCGASISDTDLEQVKQDIAEHTRDCSKNPANKKKEAPETRETATPKKTKPPQKAAVKEPPGAEKQKEEKKVKPERKSTAVSTEVLMPSDAEFRDAKTERILQSQGGFYKVAGGKEVPDAAAVQAYAVGKAKISTEVMLVEQDAKHVLVVIRCHREDVYTDASVYIDFDTQRKRELLKVANKNPKAVRGWDENGPVFDPEFKVVTEKKSVPLMVHLFNRMTDFAYFAPRTAESQAIRRGQAKMLGSEWRDAEEINTEAEEVDSVNKR